MPSFFDSTAKIVGGLTGLIVAVTGLVAALAQFGLVPTSEQSTARENTQQTTPSRTGAKSTLRVPVSGTYSGIGAERGSANKDIKVVMAFSSAGSSVSYPTLDCFGRLVPKGFEGGRRIYLERITAGRCDQGGLWRVKVSGPKRLEALWSLASANYTVSVVLQR